MRLVPAQCQPSAGAGAAVPVQRSESAVPPNLPFKKDEDTGPVLGVSSAWIGLAVVLVGVWLFVVARHRRARGGSNPAGAGLMGWLRAPNLAQGELASLGRVQLNPHASVQVVRWNGQEFLIGVTAQSVTLLAQGAAAGGDMKRPPDEVSE
ncbi:MAG TPA: flagellar biosynthetic protein FliO [Ramlibacter sp.]|nr:flagellar biosynthetic protein FliO [Ramlibacter sp.]